MPGTITIDPARVTITAANAEKVYGEDDPAFTGTVKGLVKEGDLGKINWSRTNTEEEAAGTYKGVLTASFTANMNYDVTVEPGDFTIRPRELLASAENVSAVYDGKAHGIEVKVADPAGGAVIKYGTDGSSCRLEDSPAVTDVGDSPLQVFYKVTAGSNYSEYTGSATVTLTKADQAAPSAPSAAEVTASSVRLAELKNGEYRCGDGKWQASPEFTGLAADTEYTFFQRLIAVPGQNVAELGA